ncbi:hypothetical protein GCM10011571_32530 [Marinithermofilum abyssi]|uniref:Uncharacterized protein n=1 Tax=Marinithermofilum abyssi TaxID=1571185 RepID=A0A8J2VEZ0_9BACL|nr:hypothetical protein GCM10011571_32530 [Marinithermofilum abyssi]
MLIHTILLDLVKPQIASKGTSEGLDVPPARIYPLPVFFVVFDVQTADFMTRKRLAYEKITQGRP